MPSFAKSLSARLLLFTIIFIMIAEFFAFAPSVGRAQRDYFYDKLAAAHLALLSLDASDDHTVTEELEHRLLDHAGAMLIATTMADNARLILLKESPSDMAVTIDLNKNPFFGRIIEAFRTLFASEPYKTLRILGRSPADDITNLEVVISEKALAEYLRGYAWRIFFLSLAISIFTATLVFASLHFFLARPIQQLTRSIIQFKRNPEDPSFATEPTIRQDEIGTIQNELAEMQGEIRRSLQQQSRLAAIGTGVAKINHDLRNMLATTLLLSERLETSEDSSVRKLAPNFIASIERAVNICSNTLRFAREEAPVSNPTTFSLFGLIDEIGEQKLTGSDLSFERAMAWYNEVDLRLAITADYDQLFRVIDNLVRNGQEAGAKSLKFTTEKSPKSLLMKISDDGPGFHKKHARTCLNPSQAQSKKAARAWGW